MNRHLLCARRCRLVVDRITGHIENAAQRLLAYRNRDRRTGRHGLHAAYQSVGRTHCDASNCLIAKVLCDLYDEKFPVLAGDMDSFINRRKMSLCKFDIQYRTDNLSDFTCIWHDNSLSSSILLYCIAFAPAMISVSSCVMEP